MGLHLERNMKDHFDPHFVVVKVVGGSVHEAAYKELCRRGMEYFGSHEGVQKLDAFPTRRRSRPMLSWNG